MRIFRKYMEAEALSVSQREFRENLAKKITTNTFLADTSSLLRPAIKYDAQEVYRLIDELLLKLL